MNTWIITINYTNYIRLHTQVMIFAKKQQTAHFPVFVYICIFLDNMLHTQEKTSMISIVFSMTGMYQSI